MKLIPCLLLFFFLHGAIAQSNLKTACHNMDILVKGTVEALQKNSDSLYFSLVDTAALAAAMLESLGSDPKPDAVKTFTAMRNNPPLVRKLFVTAFSKLMVSARSGVESSARSCSIGLRSSVKKSRPETSTLMFN